MGIPVYFREFLRQDSLLSLQGPGVWLLVREIRYHKCHLGPKKRQANQVYFLICILQILFWNMLGGLLFNLKLCSINCVPGFSGGSAVKKKKKPACQCRRQELDPWSGKIPHARVTRTPRGDDHSACALQAGSSNHWAHLRGLLKPIVCPEPVLYYKRSHNEARHGNYRVTPAPCN